MEIREKIDNSKLRRESEEKSIPIVDLLLRKIKDISQKEKINRTLFSVCPNSENVLKAALRAAKRAHAPIKFAATLNQVDIDGGYTGWTQNDLKKEISERIMRVGHNGGLILGPTHNVQNDTSLEKVEYFFNYAKEIGKYPIKDKKSF